MDKVIRDGKVAVLFSPGYGAGWYSWSLDVPDLLFHPELVALAEAGGSMEDCDKLIEKLFPSAAICTGGWSDIEIEWLPVGARFRIHEYDGYESIVTLEDEDCHVA